MPRNAGMHESGVRIVMLKIPCFSNDDVEKIMDVLFNWDGFFNRLLELVAVARFFSLVYQFVGVIRLLRDVIRHWPDFLAVALSFQALVLGKMLFIGTDELFAELMR